MQGILKKARPGQIEDLIALNALYRPGRHGAHRHLRGEQVRTRKRIEYPLPALEPVLKETYGVPVYQEQVMQIAQVVAGFTLGQADILRRAMGKKKPEEALKMKPRFIEGAKAKGYDQKTAERIFELLFAFTGYGFNKSHAAAYAIPAYQTIYLKANHPAEFLAANVHQRHERHGPPRPAHPRGAGDGDRGSPPGREPVPEGVHGGGGHDRLRPPRDQERRRRARWTPSSRRGKRAASSRASWISSTGSIPTR